MKKRRYEDLSARQQRELRWLLGEIAEEIAEGRRDLRSALEMLREAYDRANDASKENGAEGLLSLFSASVEKLKTLARVDATREEHAALWLQCAMCLKIDERYHHSQVQTFVGRIENVPPALSRVPEDLDGPLRLLPLFRRRGPREKGPSSDQVVEVANQLVRNRGPEFSARRRSATARCPEALAEAIQARLLEIFGETVSLSTIRRRLEEAEWELPLSLRAPRR